MTDNRRPAQTVSEALDAVRTGRLGEVLRMLAHGELDQEQLEETLQLYHSALEIQNDELRQSQLLIKTSQHRFMRLFDTQPTPLLLMDEQGVVLSVNQAARKRFGLSDEQIRGRSFKRMVSPQDQALFLEMLDELVVEQETGLIEMQLESASGPFSCALGLARQKKLDTQRDEDGLYEVIAHVVDISALKRKERELQQQAELLENVSNEVPGALFQFRLYENGWQFDYVSAGIEPLHGHSREDLLNDANRIFESVHPEDRPRLRLLLHRLYIDPQPWEGEYRVRPRADAQWRWVRSSIHPQSSKAEQGAPIKWYGYITDITETREATRMLIAHARRAAMGDMLGNIAHQWKQPLNALALNLSNLEDAAEAGELDRLAVDSHIGKARQLIDQMTQTIQDFVSFFRPDKKHEAFAPTAMAHQALDLLSTALQHHGIAYSEDYPAALPMVSGQPTELMQVMMILLQNAEEALRGRGIQAPRIALSARLEPGWVILDVADNAGGIDEAVQVQMFEPYFSTKDAGSGIGLYLARLIVESTFDGKIRCRSDVEGTVFSVELPAFSPAG